MKNENTATRCDTSYAYDIGKTKFEVTPVYSENSQSVADILLRLMKHDYDSASCA